MNSKATLRLQTKDFLHMIPEILHSKILASRYYADNSKSLVIQGESSRSQKNNIVECYKKLHALVVAAGRNTVRGETSPSQIAKVKNLSVYGT